MAERTVKKEGKSSETNGEGNEKVDNSSSTVTDIQGYSITDSNPKIAGMAAGYREATRTK